MPHFRVRLQRPVSRTEEAWATVEAANAHEAGMAAVEQAGDTGWKLPEGVWRSLGNDFPGSVYIDEVEPVTPTKG